MKNILYFCEKCGHRVPNEDLESGAAIDIGDNRAIGRCCQSSSPRRGSARTKKPRESGPVRQTTSTALPGAGKAESRSKPASRSTGNLPRMTPGRGTPKLTKAVQGPSSAGQTSSHAHAARPRPSSAREADSNTLIYVGAGVLGVAVLAAVLFAVTSGPPDQPKPSGRTPVAQKPDKPDKPEPTPRPAPKPAPPIVKSDPEADRALDEAQAFARTSPDDRDGYYYRLLSVVRRFGDTDAGHEAKKLLDGIVFPSGTLPADPDWYTDWEYAQGADKAVPHFEYDGQYAVVETHASGQGQARTMKRRMTIDPERPYLEFNLRGAAGKPSRFEVKPADQSILTVQIDGATWQRVSIDCSSQKGQEVEFVMVHHAGTTGSEPVFLTAPSWRANPTAGATLASLSGTVSRPEPPRPEDTDWAHAVDLLALAKPDDDAVFGTWKKEGKALASDDSKLARFALPYRPPEEYDYRVDFTRRAGDDTVVLHLARGTSHFVLQIACWDNQYCAFDRVDGKGAKENSTTIERGIETGRRYTALVQVRKDSVRAYLDGEILTQLATDYTNLSMRKSEWNLADKQGQLGLGSNLSEVVFHSAQVREVTGKGVTLREDPNAPRIVDLLTHIDVAKDKIDGNWELKNRELHVSESKERSRFVLPYVPPEEYDFVFTVTLTEKQGQICQTFSQGDHTLSFVAVTSDPKNIRCGYEMFDGKSISDNPSLVSGKPILVIGKQHTFVTQVRKDGLKTLLDGSPLAAYQTDCANTSMHPAWSLGEKGKGRLGVSVKDAPYVFHQVKVIEISGRGRIERFKGPAVAVPKPPTNRKAKQAWAVFLEQALGAVQQGKLDVLRSRIKDAQSNAELAPLKARVAKDVELLDFVLQLKKATLDGLALLKDGRAFTFKPKEGDPLEVGKGKPNRILKVEGDQIEIEQSVGGGKLVLSRTLSEFTPNCHLDLARLALTEKPADQIKLLVPVVAAHVPGTTGEALDDLNTALDAVANDAAQAPRVARLRAWMKHREHEQAFELALAETTGVIEQGKYEPAQKAVQDFKNAYFDTAAFANSSERIAALEKRSHELRFRPGLWGMFYNGNDLKASKELKKLNWNYGGGSPAAGVGKDNFRVRAKGLLIVKEAGTYEFQARGDDHIELWIAGKKVCASGYKRDTVGTIELTAGRHGIGLKHSENSGIAYWRVKWKKPGDKAFSYTPLSALKYDVTKKEEYKK